MKRSFVWIAMVLLSASRPVWAGDDVCSGPQDGQKATYCEAAKDADKSKTTATAGMAIWGVVTGVCTYACAMSTNPSYAINAWWCMGSSMAGSVADIALTMALSKDMQSSMSGLVGAGAMGLNVAMQMKGIGAYNKSLSAAKAQNVKYNNAVKSPQGMEGGEVSKAGKLDRDTGACISAVIAGLQVGMKAMTMSQASDTKAQNLANAASVDQQRRTTLQADTIAGGAAAISPGGSGALAGSGAPAGSGSAVEAAIQGALAENPQLKKMFDDPNFGKTFEKSAGMPIGDYFKQMAGGGSAGDAMSKALGAASNTSEIKAKGDDIQRELAMKMGNYTSSGTYAGGGGGATVASNEGDDLSKAMEKMLGVMMGADGQPMKPDELKKLQFALEGSDPSKVAENKSISLFTRVAYRYRKANDRIDQLPWAAGMNRPLNSSPQRNVASDPMAGPRSY